MSRTLSGLISGDTDLNINVSLDNLTADNITSGVFPATRIPSLSANIITTEVLNVDRVPQIQDLRGALDTSDIPDLSSVYINKATFKTLVANANSYADFQTAVANM